MSTLADARPCDVLIVGMGPAGATAASHLSRAGLSVIGLEKYRLPRYKVCGGGLSARLSRHLDPEFLNVVETTIYNVQFAYKGADSFLIESPVPIAYMVMRDRFDHLLVQQARGSGTEVHEGEQAVEVHSFEDGVTVTTNRARYQARVVIGADGANSLVARQLFPLRQVPSYPGLESEIGIGGLQTYFGTKSILIDVGVVDQGYAWVFPKQARLSAGVAEFRSHAASPKRAFARFVDQEEALSSFPVPPPHGHPLPLFYDAGTDGPVRLTAARALLVGDAGRLVDPLFGEGIYYAVRSGQLAAAAILTMIRDRRPDALQEYERTVAQELYPEFRVAARLADLIYTFPHLCYRLMRRYRDLLTLYCDVLTGQKTYPTFYTAAKSMVTASLYERLGSGRSESR